MENNLSLFDHSEYSEFNRDYVALCHELGHIVTWFSLGQGIGQLTCRRCPSDGLLEPHVTLWPRVGEGKLLCSPEYAEPYAERLLAGEVAARFALGKQKYQICSKGLPVDADTNHLANVLAQIDVKENIAKEDIVKVLKLALNNAQSEWRAWIAERLSRANTVVNQNWAAIDKIARKLEPRLPTGGKSRIWTGGEMIAQMERCGVLSDKRPAVEIVYKSHLGGFLTRLRRFLQEMGSKGIICRYEDDPAEKN